MSSVSGDLGLSVGAVHSVTDRNEPVPDRARRRRPIPRAPGVAEHVSMDCESAHPASAPRRLRTVIAAGLAAAAMVVALCAEGAGPNPPKCPGIDPELCDPPPG